MIEILRTIYQIMLILTITFVAVARPDHIGILMLLCTLCIVSVIREGNENRCELPSVHPEIIRCKDCKHYKFWDKRCDWTGYEDVGENDFCDDFCSRIERRTDGHEREN